MTDKVQKIREEVVRMHNLLPITDGDNISVNYADRICTSLEMYIDSMQEEPAIPDIVDEHWWEMLGEEPVSEDMWEASKQYALRQVFASTDTEMTEQAYLSLKLFSGFEIAVAHKDGANWQKQKDKSKVLYLPNDSSHPAGKRCLNLSKLSDNDIEYIRKDAFIEKAEEYIYKQLNEGCIECGDIERFIEGMKNYMKGE